MARKKKKRNAGKISDKHTEVSDDSELSVLKCDEICIDDEQVPTATKGFKNCRSNDDEPKCNETEVFELPEDVKPDLTILENIRNENHDVAIISSENRPVVFERVKAETSENESNNNGGNSDDDSESENLGAVLTDEEMSSNSSITEEDSEEGDDDEMQSDSDPSWTDCKSKTKKNSQKKTEPVKEPTATNSKGQNKSKKERKDYKRFICHYCEKRFGDKKDLSRHLMSRHEKKNCPHKCPLCKFVSAYRADLIRHLRNIHELVQTEEGDYIEVPRDTPALPDKRHTCDICGYKARWNAHLVRHKRTKHSQAKTFKCTFPGCNRSYKLQDHLRRHAKHHLLAKNERQLAENAEDPWWRSLASEVPELIKCPAAGCYFETYCVGDLRIHSIAHTEEMKYVCDYPECDYRSKWLRPLQEHELIHYPQRGLACSVDGCEFRTACKRRLDCHAQSHSNKPRFPCDQEGCDFRGITQESLRQHRRLKHKVNANFQCPYCPKRFCLPRTLHTHVKSHEANDTNKNERTGRHQCSECSKVCANAYNLSSHMKKHANNSQIQGKGKQKCPECSKVCASAYHLSSHMKKHAKVKQKPGTEKHECPECSKVCRTAYNLSSHMRAHLKKQHKSPQGQLRKSQRTDKTVNTEEIEDPIVFKVEDEIKSEAVSLSLDAVTVTQVVQASVDDTCALLREMVANS